MAERRRTNDAIPSGITREHVLKALIAFNQEGLPSGFKPSHTYDIVHQGRHYPPPAIVALAIKELTGVLPSPIIRAGEGTKCFAILRDCGFTIVRKSNSSTRD